MTVVILSGIVMLVRPLQPENALLPILVTPSWIVTPVRLLHARNAESLIVVTVSGIVYAPDRPAGQQRSVVAVLFKRTPSISRKYPLAASTVISVRELQYPNANEPKFFTLLRSVMLSIAPHL